MRKLLVLAAALLAAGCGARHEATPTVAQPTIASPPVAAVPHDVAVQVTVVDGDTNRRVRGAHVRVGGRVARSDRQGIAHVPLAHRAPLITSAAKPGYSERAVRLSFRTHPKSTIRIYRSTSQWTMYGAVPGRTQAQPVLRVRPPFRVVWSRGIGTLIEFPAVVSVPSAHLPGEVIGRSTAFQAKPFLRRRVPTDRGMFQLRGQVCTSKAVRV